MDSFEDEIVSARTDSGIRKPSAQIATQVIITPMKEEASKTSEQDEFNEKDFDKKEQYIPTGWTRFYSIPYYAQYFDVTQTQVLVRIKAAIVIPHCDDFLSMTQNKPDFYGAFWISTTIIFLLATVGNLSNYLMSFVGDDLRWQHYFFKLQFARQAITLIFTASIGLPASFYLYLRFFTTDQLLTLPHAICLYGYSLSGLIPALVLCILPFGWLQYLFLLYGFANSTYFMFVSLKGNVTGIGQKGVWIMIAAFQVILLLCIKWLFLSEPQAIMIP